MTREVPLTPLEPWIAAKIGAGGGADEGGPGLARLDGGCVDLGRLDQGRLDQGRLDRGRLDRGRLDLTRLRSYQLAKLNETLSWVQRRSAFYRRLFGRGAVRLSTLEGLQELPFTTADDLRAAPLDFVCVKPDEVERIVTLPTSGTTGPPKRLFFTAADQELTRDFFHHGMSTMVTAGDRVLILLPGSLPGSVGDLLKDGLERMGAQAIVHGPVADPQDALDLIYKEQVTALVGIPVQVLRLARLARAEDRPRPECIRSVLLSTDRVPQAIVRALEETWGCLVYNHYGTTEMGLGGGVDCRARDGYHLREADLLFEVVDPSTGQPLPDGQVGEVVFTTLSREAMPLVRYRTGDLSRLIPGPCPCGTVLRRMAHVDRRVTGGITLSGGETLYQGDFDEALFPIEGLVDFRVLVAEGREPATLIVEVRSCREDPGPDRGEILDALRSIPALAEQMARRAVAAEVVTWKDGGESTSGVAKRRIRRQPEA